jgi:hypothetical protein
MSHKVNLVRVLTSATGNSTPITLGAAYSQLFMLPSEAGAIDGRTYTYLIVDGNNWELGKGVYTASGTSLARTTVLASRISGTLGTSRITLSGTAQVRFIEAADDMDGVRGTRAVTGTTDTLNNSDLGFVVTYSNASAIAVSLAQASVSNLFMDGWAVWVKNKGAGSVTITPATSTIDGVTTLVLAQNQGALIWSDGTNYQSLKLRGDLGTAAVRADTDFVRTDIAQSLTATQRGQAAANLQFVSPPQGRLTLQTGVPVMTTTQSAKSAIYYTPYVGNQIPLYDGTNMVPTAFSELSVATTDTTKNPAAIGASKLNDWFVWDDSGTRRLTHGPDWTNDTTRSAGTTLVMVNGVLLNNASITNGPAASRGTYVGTTRSDPSSQLNWIIGGSGSGGVAGFLGIWNMYNRHHAVSFSKDSGASYGYATAITRQARGSAGNQVSFVSGMAEDSFIAIYSAAAVASGAANASAVCGIGYDNTAAVVSTKIAAYSSSGTVPILATGSTNYSVAAFGFHIVSANEIGDGTNANAFNNTADNTLTFTLMM